MFLRLGRDLRGLKCRLWMYCLFLKFEERVCLPVEGEPEVQKGPGVGFVQKTTKQYRSCDKSGKGFLSTKVWSSLSCHCDGRLLDNDRRAFVAPVGCK